MDLEFIVEKIPLVFATVILVYCILRLLFRRAVLSFYDPLHVNIVLISFYCFFFAMGFFLTVGRAFWVIALLLTLYFCVASIPKMKRLRAPQFLQISLNIQILFSCLVLMLFLANLGVNILSGPIPLFEGGSDERYLLNQNSRVLNWLNAALASMPILLYSYTDSSRVQKINGASLFIFILSGILSASKSSIISILLLYFNYIFILGLKGRRPSKRMRQMTVLGLIVGVLSFPIAIVAFKAAADPREALAVLATRLAGGFDQLIHWVLNDIEPKSYGLSLAQIYFLPLLKIFSFESKYNSVIDYFYGYFLDRDTTEGMFPNSNFIMEAVFTNGVWGGLLLIPITAYFCFRLRKHLLERRGLKLYHLFLAQFFVLAPFYWLIDGQRFVVSAYTALILYGILVFFFNLPRMVAAKRFIAY